MVVLIPGHNARAQGAINTMGASEHVFGLALVEQVRQELSTRGVPSQVMERDPETDLVGLVPKLDSSGALFAVSFHADAVAGLVYSAGAFGIHSPGDGLEGKIAADVAFACSQALGIPFKGRQERADLYLMRRPRIPVALVEIYNTDNPGETEKAMAALRSGRLAIYVANAISDLVKTWAETTAALGPQGGIART